MKETDYENLGKLVDVLNYGIIYIIGSRLMFVEHYDLFDCVRIGTFIYFLDYREFKFS